MKIFITGLAGLGSNLGIRSLTMDMKYLEMII